MFVDKKHKSRLSRKRKFHGNRFTKRDSGSQCLVLDLDLGLQSETNPTEGLGVEGSGSMGSSDVDLAKCKQSATPTLTRSEIKTQSLPSDLESDENDSSSDSNLDLRVDAEDIEGNRIVDVGLLNRSISSMLFCKFCHGIVKMV
ncbi:hypothetical protein PoB_000379800 [Plakobranchus ocellatus]|uniref:Uncharacterized protein n=1 Tax=Plakobranchus ocellatus TaxID=259542 RepID=A0AAV3Y4I1_9GAST|nr:hypothetical protein PoB_000379800 [Plakobranchus ocellatus]